VRCEKYGAATINRLARSLGIGYDHAVQQGLFADARLTNGVYDLLTQIGICGTANPVELSLALVGELAA
jgi:hypothetical protein